MASFSKIKYGENRLCILNYDTTGNQEIINVPYIKSGLTAQLSPVGGSASLSISNDGVNWIMAPEGFVSVSTMMLIIPIRFIRVNSNAATCTIAIWGF